MLAGLTEFAYRLLSPIEDKNARIYRYDTAYGQLAAMLVLALICYQFTIVGDSVYMEAIRSFIRNSTIFLKLQFIPLPLLPHHDLGCFVNRLCSQQDFWNLSHLLWVIVKALIMSIVVGGYALARTRTFYVRTVITGVLHIMAVSQLVIALITLTFGVLLALATLPIGVQIIMGISLVSLCVLSLMLLFNVVGRIIGACVSGSVYEGVTVMIGSAIICSILEGIYTL